MTTLKIRIISSGLLFRVFFLLTAAALTAKAEPQLKICSNPSENGLVLLQHATSAMAIEAFSACEDPTWISGLSNAGCWVAVAADRANVLIFNQESGSIAVCSLDQTGQPTGFLRIKCDITGFTPVALEGSRVLVQVEEMGALKQLDFDDNGDVLQTKIIWQDSLGWLVRGIDCNRILLEHSETGDVAIWAANPKVPLFNPYKSFSLPDGWSVRDFSGDFVLIQDELSGIVSLVELGENYCPDKFTELAAGGNGWRAVALTL